MSYQLSDSILEATNGGLDIILSYYPQAQKAVEKKNEKFKIRESEKTASCSLFNKGGVWLVTDWGGDGKSRNGINICMLEDNLTFGEALKLLAGRYKVANIAEQSAHKPGYTSRKAKADEKEGDFTYTARDFTNAELSVLGPRVTQTVCHKYFLFAADHYTTISKKQSKLIAHTWSSTEHYPIFIFEVKHPDGTSYKKYEPLNPEKKYRFRWFNGRPKNHIFGLSQSQQQFNSLNTELGETDPRTGKTIKEEKLDKIIICSGDSDSLNCAAMGYPVVWLNSESAKLTSKQFKQLTAIAKKVYNVPDLDITGQREGHRLAMQFLDLHTIELPKSLLKILDWRGNPCKDLKDFSKHHKYKKDFEDLINTSMPYRMWDEIHKYDKDGNFSHTDYKLNPAHTYNFLEKNGFYRFKQPGTKQGYIYIRINGNVVEEIDAVEIKTFITDFIKHRKFGSNLRNIFYRSQAMMAESSMSNLHQKEIDFTSYTKTSQYLIFKNQAWEVSAKQIKIHKQGESPIFTWADAQLLKHNVKPQTEPFTITYNENKDEHSIKINNPKCLFLKFLINTSRIHWRQPHTELTPHQIQEQHTHLINKIYTLGYLLHRYKDPSRPWCVYGMDNKVSEAGESHGGTGKSIAAKAAHYFMKTVTLPGRSPKLTENPHIYENVTAHTDFVLIDDANQNLKFDFFFSDLTGEMIINPKHGKSFEIPFHSVPKLGITSNYTLRTLDPSTERRLQYWVFSDYYHIKKEGEYTETLTPYQDLGKNLFLDFNQEEWNHFYNTMAYCLKAYLTLPRIEPPMENVILRQLRTQMGDAFKEWADIYFNIESEQLNTEVSKETAYRAYKDVVSKFPYQENRFKKAIIAWCKYNSYEFNPPQVTGKDGRIIKKVDGHAKEFIYIQTPNSAINKQPTEQPTQLFNPTNNDAPF